MLFILHRDVVGKILKMFINNYVQKAVYGSETMVKVFLVKKHILQNETEKLAGLGGQIQKLVILRKRLKN